MMEGFEVCVTFENLPPRLASVSGSTGKLR